MEEKIMILKMLQDGKITAEEAYKLLDAIDGNNKSTKEDINAKKFEENINELGEKAGKIAERLGEQFSTNSEKFSEEFSKKIESVSSDIAKAAVKFTDKMMNYFESSINMSEDKYAYEKSYDFDIEDIKNLAVSLNTSNFQVCVLPNDSNKITLNIWANTFAESLEIDNYFKTIQNTDSINFICQFPNRTWGKIEIKTPKALRQLNITTSNSKCMVNGLTLSNLQAMTSNAKIEIENCTIENLEGLTDNSSIRVYKCYVLNSSVRTSNSKIDFSDSSILNLTAKTSNGPINIQKVKKLNQKQGIYNLITSNGKIDVDLLIENDCSYEVDAKTSIGNINISLPQLNYSMDKKDFSNTSHIQIKSEDFDSNENNLVLKATTSNSSIKISGERI